MRLRDCFTVDLEARSEPVPSFFGIINKLVFDPGYRAVAYYRVAVQLRKARRLRRLKLLLSQLLIVRICRVPGLEIRTIFEIGPGLVTYHPHDIVIGAGARIGRCVTLYNGVTLGARTLKKLDEGNNVEDRYPTLEEGVTVFPGAKVIGPVTIGANSVVGTNSVVTTSFPPNSVIAGVPAARVGENA
jgi:serine O-acetyltransferase